MLNIYYKKLSNDKSPLFVATMSLVSVAEIFSVAALNVGIWRLYIV